MKVQPVGHFIDSGKERIRFLNLKRTGLLLNMNGSSRFLHLYHLLLKQEPFTTSLAQLFLTKIKGNRNS